MSHLPKVIKKCLYCKKEFSEGGHLKVVCSAECSINLILKTPEKARLKIAAAQRKETRLQLDALRTKPQLVAVAQKAFNEFIRSRDTGKPCISCGAALIASALGGGFDAGHYRSVGSAVHMRFVEDNAHGQCKYCNRHLSGNHVAYRAGLIARIGVTAVEFIEADATLRKYTKEGLIEIARHYKAEAKKLKTK